MNIIGFGDIHGPKPYESIGFGDIHGPKPYESIGVGANLCVLVSSPTSRTVAPKPTGFESQMTPLYRPRQGLSHPHGCTLGGNFQFFKDRKSVILGVWAAPGARQTIPLGGGPGGAPEGPRNGPGGF